MLRFLTVLATVFDLSFLVFFFIFFYLSIKKCFWKGDRSKIALVVVTFFSSPFVSYLLIVVVAYGAVPFFGDQSLSEHMQKMEDPVLNVVAFSVVGALYLASLFLVSRKITKWLHAKSSALVSFVYLMYGVIMTLTMVSPEKDAFAGHPYVGEIVYILADVLMLLATFLMYRLICKDLARLVDRQFGTNWKVFVLPPAAFIFIYSSVSMALMSFSYLSGQGFFAIFAVFLFIWAFYVIIKNFNATAEALEARNNLKELSVEVMEALAHTIDAKDEYTKGHSTRVAKYSRMLAERMNFSDEECENIYYMALLHDIGKIGVPNEIINSTSKLTDEEYAIIKKHPALGADILSEIKSKPDLVIGARWHHERFDGHGYPDGKSGTDIPLMARIIGVADSYDAMTSNRSYRKYLPQDAVRSELVKNSGTQFDPEIAACMIAIMDEDTEYSMHE